MTLELHTYMYFLKISFDNSIGYDSILFDETLTALEQHTFDDSYSLNFFLQTLQKKYDIDKCLIIFHDKDSNQLNLKILQDVDDFFIENNK